MSYPRPGRARRAEQAEHYLIYPKCLESGRLRSFATTLPVLLHDYDQDRSLQYFLPASHAEMLPQDPSRYPSTHERASSSIRDSLRAQSTSAPQLSFCFQRAFKGNLTEGIAARCIRQYWVSGSSKTQRNPESSHARGPLF